MKHHSIYVVLAATLLSLGISPSQAVENQAAATGEAGSTASARSAQATKTHATKKDASVKRKPVAMPKPVDINSAKKEELKKLPGIGDAEAEKIIAGRPYGSKTWLVSNKIIPEGLYMSIAGLIEARQPFKDGAKNAAIYKKLNDQKANEKKAGDKKQ